MSIITISRQMLSYGDEIAASLSSKLGWPLFTREKIISEFLGETLNAYELRMLGESCKHFLKESVHGVSYLEYISDKLYEYSQKQSFIIVGFGSQIMFADDPDSLHFRIIAADGTRLKRVKKLYNVDDEEAELIVKKADKKQRKFLSTLYGEDISEPSNYHVIYNTSLFSVQECVAGIMCINSERESRLKMQKQTNDVKAINNVSEIAVLKTESEIEFAKILDMYQIEWQYEPTTFPVKWDDEGNITSAFTPDFYLPNFDTYIELTTMNQKYVTEKNRKVKRLIKLYPGTNIRIVYKKDFHSLVERFKMGKGE